MLSTVKSAFELQNSEDICIDYADVTVKSAQWSSDGRGLAILYQGAVGNLNRLGDAVRILEVDLVRCEAVDPLVIDEFPGDRFIPDGLCRGTCPAFLSLGWGRALRVQHVHPQRRVIGELYLYDISTAQEERINPVRGTCCYRGATFSPDGTYILFAFQDIGRAPTAKPNCITFPRMAVKRRSRSGCRSAFSRTRGRTFCSHCGLPDR
ncbi:MAG: hypothetical protein M0C28_44590 [Candidatus Moduliflexus flocculans]|nr:hypothetical protein [Candidatus Moduliflexus flocculans]